MSNELVNDDDYIDYSQGVRKQIADHLMPDGKIPDDKDQLGALLMTLDGMSRTALGNKKVKSDSDGNKNTAAAIQAISNITERLGNTDPFRRKEGETGTTIQGVKVLDVSKLPQVNTVPGETDIGVATTTYDEFTAEYEETEKSA